MLHHIATYTCLQRTLNSSLSVLLKQTICHTHKPLCLDLLINAEVSRNIWHCCLWKSFVQWPFLCLLSDLIWLDFNLTYYTFPWSKKKCFILCKQGKIYLFLKKETLITHIYVPQYISMKDETWKRLDLRRSHKAVKTFQGL